MSTSSSHLHALAPPPPLLSRKRRPSLDADSSNRSARYFSEAAYARFSAFGDRALGRQHGASELRRTTNSYVTTEGKATNGLRTTEGMKPRLPASGAAASALPATQTRTHLLARLAARKPAGDAVVDARAIGAARRLSSLTLPQHEAYTALATKRILAQRSGVPAILALTPAESAQWAALDAGVREEQADLRRDLEAVARCDIGAVAAKVPVAVDAWCRNDVFQMYARYYEAAVRVATEAEARSGRALCSMKHVQEVFAVGQSPAVSEEQFVAGMALHVLPTTTTAAAATATGDARRPPISADAHAEKLMDKFACDVAISSSALLALFDIETDNRYGGKKLAAAGRASVLAALQTSNEPPSAEAQGRTTYQVWELDGRRILVRLTTHARLVPTREDAPSASASKPVPLSVFVKPDYKFLGVDEQITRSEKRRFWLHSWLRGGAALLVGHLDPHALTVASWVKHSLASLMYGHDAHRQLPDWFEPMEHFQIVNEVFAVTMSFGAGSYLVRSSHGRALTAKKGKGTGGDGSSCNDVIVFAAASGLDSRSVVVAGAGQSSGDTLDLFQFITSAREPVEAFEFVLPTWTYVAGQVPYCFRTGTYCPSFFESGVCARTERRERCEAVHLRFAGHGAEPPPAAESSRRFWRLEDHDKRLKVVTKLDPVAINSVKLPPPKSVRFQYKFCLDARPIDAAAAPCALGAPLRCPKPAGECAQSHPTLHAVLEHVADEVLRSERAYKKSSRKKQRVQQAAAAVATVPSSTKRQR
ncbi:hypothetical protein PybrP1_009309 [[Pythium] brassicae (nom. inval.)]|nr:hypothetical protein PybrP1_009309 [[Pythium] brassicae (nom. inval.)]